MDPIPIATYRRPVRALRVRDAAFTPRLRRESVPGERILADLPLVQDDHHAVERILARYAAVRVMAGGRDHALARRAHRAWRGFLEGTAEGRALEEAVRSDGRERYTALRRAACAAAGVGHMAGAFALACLAWEIAREARARGPARRAARAAARWARMAGATGTARQWTRRARRLVPADAGATNARPRGQAMTCLATSDHNADDGTPAGAVPGE